MKHFPHYRQLDQMDCGPTCLRIIAKHYGKSIPVNLLRSRAQTGKEGTSLLMISEAAESIGFRTLSARVSFEDLVTQGQLPCIIHWKNDHFVVLHKIVNEFSLFNYIKSKVNKDKLKKSIKFIVSDPGKKNGGTVYDAEEFQSGWQPNTNSGIVLFLEPTADFYDSEYQSFNPYDITKISKYLLRYKYFFWQLLFGTILGSALQLIFPLLTQSIVDIGVNTNNISFIYLILMAQLTLTIGRYSIDFIRAWTILYISNRININILSDFVIKLMNLPNSFFETMKLGDIVQRIQDNHRIEGFLTNQSLAVIFSFVNLCIFSVILYHYNTLIFITFIIFTILYISWVIIFLKGRRKLDHRRFEAMARNQGNLIQLVQGIQEIKLAGAEKSMRWAWERLQIRSFNLQAASLTLNQYQQTGALLLNELKNVLITFLAAKAVIGNQLTLGSMLAIQYIIGQLNSPVEQLVIFVQGLQDTKISLERLNEIHIIPDEESLDKDLGFRPLNLNQDYINGTDESLFIKDLYFSYPGSNEYVLYNVNIAIPAGKKTAIVGMSGSGKSTLLKLLLKFYELKKGGIYVGSTHINYISHKYWRSMCGVVSQDGFLFSDTIANNIAIGSDHIDYNKLDNAARISNLKDLIDTFPAGYQTVIGAEGKGLSQGQKQRILIARAVYKNPKYIFLDEATNALDATNESQIVNELNAVFSGHTIVVVAHRLSTIRDADQIVVMNKGRVAEVGDHDSLIQKKGIYWELIKNQLKATF